MKQVIKPVKSDLAGELRLFYEMHSLYLDDKKLPYFYSFPINSCQGASIILAVFLYFTDELNKDVKIVRGESLDHIQHYWVTTQGRLYDLTIDQFSDIEFTPKIATKYSNLKELIINKTHHPLDSFFIFKYEYPLFHSIADFCTNAIEANYFMEILNFIKLDLESKGWTFSRAKYEYLTCLLKEIKINHTQINGNYSIFKCSSE